ncbi:hypothetical protein Bca52824_023347 [Brassica carinata]|uniref:Uncharacterized protein n=1 Tax=Brassica carinata TaxID=52824 RepID=A0A8X7VIU7_BRACI|nr:hypothetical protein Bca52824_023347 [Brassica carinata]
MGEALVPVDLRYLELRRRDQQGKLWCLTPEELKESHVRLVEPRGMQDPAIHNILTDPVMRKN